MNNNTTRTITYVFGIGMAILMVLSLFLPALTGNLDTSQTDQTEPTEVPIPTFAPPLEDFSGISFDEQYLHPSGLYAVSVPTGWDVVPPPPTGPTGVAELSLNGPDTESVITTMVEVPPAPVETTEDLSGYFNAGRLAGSWPRFQRGSQELRRDLIGDRLMIEFALEDAQRREFFARHTSWTDGEWIYTVRVVVPNNAVNLLDFLLEPVIEGMEPLVRFQDTPLSWEGYFDEQDRHVLRYPSTWQLTDGGSPGQPTSFESVDGTIAFVEAESETLANEDAAREWVESLRGGIEVDTVQPVTREGGEGWQVAYTYTDPDGAPHSGLAVLLNGVDDQLHVATALLPQGGIDLLEDEDPGGFAEVKQALDTFSLVTGLNLAAPEVEAAEEDAEATPEVTEDAATDATPEVTDEVASEATPEATGETAEAPDES